MTPDVPDVPDTSAGWYLRIVGSFAELPEPVRIVLGSAAQALPVVIALMLVLNCLRARHRSDARLARALAAPVVAGLAYALSEVAKHVKDVDRPCRLVPGPELIASCPPVGDFSLPSNHATVAAAAAVALLFSGRVVGSVAAVLALATAASRVLVGLHFPHDVLAGLVIGAVVGMTLPVVAAALRPAVRALTPPAQTVHPGRTKPLS